jgi:hypothetical protein
MAEPSYILVPHFASLRLQVHSPSLWNGNNDNSFSRAVVQTGHDQYPCDGAARAGPGNRIISDRWGIELYLRGGQYSVVSSAPSIRVSKARPDEVGDLDRVPGEGASKPDLGAVTAPGFLRLLSAPFVTPVRPLAINYNQNITYF